MSKSNRDEKGQYSAKRENLEVDPLELEEDAEMNLKEKENADKDGQNKILILENRLDGLDSRFMDVESKLDTLITMLTPMKERVEKDSD